MIIRHSIDYHTTKKRMKREHEIDRKTDQLAGERKGFLEQTACSAEELLSEDVIIYSAEDLGMVIRLLLQLIQIHKTDMSNRI